MDMIKLAAIFIAIPAAAFAHEWYDTACCNTIDCAQVPARTIQLEDGSYLVRLSPGDHPFVTGNIQVVIPADSPKVRISQDDFYHACVTPLQRVLCIYVPGVFG